MERKTNKEITMDKVYEFWYNVVWCRSGLDARTFK